MRVRVLPRAGFLILVTACTVMLSGCFIIPLADGRSPFDDPGGPSFARVASQHAPVQAALDEAIPDGWTAEVVTGHDNCEGACLLRLEVQLTPDLALGTDPATDPSPSTQYRDSVSVPFPAAALRSAVQATVPLAASAKLDIAFIPRCAEGTVIDDDGADVSVCAEIAPSARTVFGLDEDFVADEDFRLFDREFLIRSQHRTSEQLLARLD